MSNLTTKNQQQAKRIAELEAQIVANEQAAADAPTKTEIQRVLESGANARFNINIGGHDFVIHKGFLMFGKDPDGLALLEGLEAALYAGDLAVDDVIPSETTLVVGKEKEADKAVEINGVKINCSGSASNANNAGGFTRSTVQMPS